VDFHEERHHSRQGRQPGQDAAAGFLIGGLGVDTIFTSAVAPEHIEVLIVEIDALS
jgi:hypothetical protein